MKYNLITFRSITFAQQGERVLQNAGVNCMLMRTPKHLQERGCSYCLKFKGYPARSAAELLRQGRVNFGKVYTADENGNLGEWIP